MRTIQFMRRRTGQGLNGLGNRSGFTLVELLIVMGMLAVFMAAVFSLYQTQQRSAYVGEEMAEVQQNLRVAMSMITGDLKMAGFLIPAGTNAINAFTDNSVGTPDLLTLNTGSETSVAARIVLGGSLAVSVAPGGTLDLTVSSMGGFVAQDVTDGTVVTLVGPESASQVVDQQLTVLLVNPAVVCGAAAAPCLRLRNDTLVNAVGSVNNGHIIVKTGTTYPNTVAYSVVTGGTCPTGQSCISRSVNAGAATILANNVTDLQFRYIQDNGTEVDAPTDLSLIRAVRVSINGATADTVAFAGESARARRMISVARLRNR